MKIRSLLLTLFLALSHPGWALLPDEENTIRIFKEASPSVVFVTNITVVRDIFMDEFTIPAGVGTGFVWDNQGHIVTNFHVVQNASSFLITLKDANHEDVTQLEARLVGVEPRKDIAVLKIVKGYEHLKPIKLGRFDTIQVGQKAIAIGNPFGLDNSVTTGIVSAVGRQVQGAGGVTIRDMIQTDAAINMGNSGGPLLNSDGELIGMNTQILSPSGGSTGVGFAVPVSFIRRIVPQLIRHGKVIQPGIGISILSEQQKYYLLGRVGGVVVRDVSPNTPAAKAGLQGIRRDARGRLILGDIIVAIDGKEIKDYDDLYNTLDAYKIGDTVKLTLQRAGRKRTLPVQLIGI